MTLSVLADICRDQGKQDEAEGLYGRSLTALEREFGADHPDVTIPLLGWGRLHMARGNHAAADPLLQRVLTIRERVLGVDHPETVEARAEYASL
jgi:hypothetical protein